MDRDIAYAPTAPVGQVTLIIRRPRTTTLVMKTRPTPPPPPPSPLATTVELPVTPVR